MTILQLISSEGFYGAESMLVALSQSLEQIGHRVVIGVFDDARNSHREVQQEAQRRGLVTELVPCEGRFDWGAVKKIRALMETHSVEILHSHGYKADIYGYLAARTLQTALVSTCHNWPDPSAMMQFYAVVDRMVLRGFQQVTTPSAKVLEILEKSGVPCAKASLIANGVDIHRFEDASPTLLLPTGKQVVGIIGRLVKEKGGDILLQAAKSVLAEYANVLFVFVGDGANRKDWETLSKDLGISSSVHFTGSRNDIPGVLASCHIVALPSLNEAMPMSLLEAMAAAKPVIATNVGAIPELIKHGSTGYMVPSGDPIALAKGLLTLLRDPTLSQTLGKNGHDHVLMNFSSVAMARQYSNIYRKARIGFNAVTRAQKVENN